KMRRDLPDARRRQGCAPGDRRRRRRRPHPLLLPPGQRPAPVRPPARPRAGRRGHPVARPAPADGGLPRLRPRGRTRGHSRPGHRWGQDTIDPERTIDALDAMADRIAGALARPEPRLLFATGHPTGLLAIHLPLARFAMERGARLLTPAEGWTYSNSGFGRPRRTRYLGEVAMLDDRDAFVHTTHAEPLEPMPRELGDERRDLVIADHGWAGAAGEAGVPTVAFADCNDPGLFVGEAEGKIEVVVPLDDNVLPRYYE